MSYNTDSRSDIARFLPAYLTVTVRWRRLARL
jgi:hypothetical protein